MFYSLRSRLMLAFSILLILPITSVVFILSKESAEQIRKSTQTSTLQTIDQFATHVSTLLTQIEDMGNQVLSSGITQEWITATLNDESTRSEQFMAKKKLRELLSSYALNNSNVISISTFAKGEGGLWTQDQSYLKSSWYEQYKEQDVRWTQAHQDRDQADDSMRSREINSLVLPLVQLQSLQDVGVIKINYPTELLRQDMDKISIGKSGKAFLLTSEGHSVLHQDLTGAQQVLSDGLAYLQKHSGEQNSGIFSLRQGETDYLLFYRKLPAQNWLIIGEVPEAELYATITKLKETLLLASFVLLILVIIVALRLSTNITKPLSAMARAMRHVRNGQFELGLKDMPKARSRQSEVDYVAGVFEEMTHRLKYLIETEFETNLRRKNAEYKALLLQINPHFYNNTLEIISGLAAMKREDLVMDATEALGKMMRYSLSLDTDLVQVSEELGYIRDYLFLLKLRHEDHLMVAIQQDSAADHLLIAKFILQPLVENAVKYSLEKGGIAEVTITSRVCGARLHLQIQDNGSGMTPELIASILADTESRDSVGILYHKGDSIGLRNVLSRCRLYYGEQFEAVLDSKLHTGTTITLKLPLIEG
ncbi:histidine kinase [Paenibacillus woosongensis]|uniref:histidine kinase n=1 Tax=Paenibacillus woosongensis TaxID=307580 RepID=A0AA95I8G3_9BACL|nr:sensor histidine kinase [Paenibacillus woosongensis]WHX49369.1 histidine kinase [Paenibacillus woosongensis]